MKQHVRQDGEGIKSLDRDFYGLNIFETIDRRVVTKNCLSAYELGRKPRQLPGDLRPLSHAYGHDDVLAIFQPYPERRILRYHRVEERQTPSQLCRTSQSRTPPLLFSL